MDDADDARPPPPPRLAAVLVVAATALALALAVWHRHRTSPTLLAVALAVLHIAPATAPPPAPVDPDPHRDHKSTRSKERRRRGKDPFRDLLKGKKSKALLKAIKSADHLHPAAAGAAGHDSASSTSRSPSPDPARVSTESDDTLLNSVSAPTSSAVSDHDPSGAGPVAATDAPHASTVTRHASQDCCSSPRVPAACVDTPSQPRDPPTDATSGSCAKFVRARTRLRVLRIDARSSVASSMPPDTVASPFLSTHTCDPAPSSTPTTSRGSTPPLFASEDPDRAEQPLRENTANTQAQIASMRSALEASRLREEQLRTAAEQASKERDEVCWRWNEDANVWRMRESELQAQISHLMQQLQAYAAVASFQAAQPSNPPSGFSSPTSPHARLSPHTPYHPLASYPLPPAIQAQNPASAPAHVRALLASTPMLTSHSPGFAAPAPGGFYPGAGLGMSPLSWSGLCVPNGDPRQGGRRTPDSSASGSSPRGRQRRRRSAENGKSLSDESMGEWDGAEDPSGDDEPWEEDDIFRNNALADAILKRPESLRELSGGVGRRSGRAREGGERKDALKDPASEKYAAAPLVVPLAVGTVHERE